MIDRFENLTDKPQLLKLRNETYTSQVNIIGNFSAVIVSGCKFLNGLRIISKGVHRPDLVRISDCDVSPIDTIYPLKVNGAGRLFVNRVVCYGNGKPYSQGGSPDQFSINNTDEVFLNDCESIGGGENGYSINGCQSVVIEDSIAADNDGQGFHIGRHEFGVVSLEMYRCQSVANWKNQLSATGKGCGVLLQNVRTAILDEYYSSGHDYGVSHVNRNGIGRLVVGGFSDDKQKATFTKNIEAVVEL